MRNLVIWSFIFTLIIFLLGKSSELLIGTCVFLLVWYLCLKIITKALEYHDNRPQKQLENQIKENKDTNAAVSVMKEDFSKQKEEFSKQKEEFRKQKEEFRKKKEEFGKQKEEFSKQKTEIDEQKRKFEGLRIRTETNRNPRSDMVTSTHYSNHN